MNPSPTTHRPRVLLSPCLRDRDGRPGYWIARRHIDATRLAGAERWLVPGCGADDLPDLPTRADGLLLTGSDSNLHPSHFGEAALDPLQLTDPERDAWTLRAAPGAWLARGGPGARRPGALLQRTWRTRLHPDRSMAPRMAAC